MKHIPLLLSVIFLTGCATTSLEERTEEARNCVKQKGIENSVQSTSGLVVEATQEQRDRCWLSVNKKLDAITKREKQREAAEAAKCPRGTTKWCNKRGAGSERCGCARNEDVRRALDRLGREIDGFGRRYE